MIPAEPAVAAPPAWADEAWLHADPTEEPAPVPGWPSVVHGIRQVLNGPIVALAFYLSALVALSRTLSQLTENPALGTWLIATLTLTRQSMISSLCVILAVALASGLMAWRVPYGWRRLWPQLLAVPPGAALGAYLRHAFAAPDGMALNLPWYAYTTSFWMLLGWLAVSLLHAGRADARARRRLAQARRAHQAWATRQLEARLSALQAQIEPHFLFNTLATVKRLYETAPDQGREMMTHLTAYLRAALPSLRHPLGRVDEEFSRVRHYLSLLKMRMGERLSFDLHVEPGLDGVAVPPMAVLTLVENAVKHGLAPLPEGGHISVRAQRCEAGRLCLEVQDNGAGFSGLGGSGVGLANTRARLQAIYGDQASLALEANASSRGVVSRLILPCHAASDALPTEPMCHAA